jgi:hypothetical protein
MTLKEWSKREDLRQQLGAMLDSQSGQEALGLLRRVALSLTSASCPAGVDFQQWNSHWGSWREGYSRALRDLEALPNYDLKRQQEQEQDLKPWEYSTESN